jgi:hypothetical protein
MPSTLLPDLLATAHAVSAVVPPRTGEKVYLHLLSELGELGEEASIHAGELYKSVGPDGVVGEACDVMNCLGDLVWKKFTDPSKEQMSSAVKAITEATRIEDLDHLPVLSFAEAKSDYAVATSDLRAIHEMKWSSDTALTAGQIESLGTLCRATLLLAKAAAPDLTSAAFLEAYTAKCDKWRSKATGT